MPLVRILKPLGFEQPGEIVHFRGNIEEAIERGEVEVLDADPRPMINSTTVQEPIVEEPEEEIEEIPAEEKVESIKPTKTTEIEGK